MSCDAEHFYIQAKVTAFEDEEGVNERVWERTIVRDHL